jgi:hypothetical protein
LPGKALVVFDPAREVITDRIPSEDAYPQKRALLGEVLPRVQAGEWWIADATSAPRGCWGDCSQRGAVG